MRKTSSVILKNKKLAKCEVIIVARKKRKLKNGQELHQRATKVRIYPTVEQEVLLAKTFGCCRFIWNQMLSDEKKFYSETDKHFIPTPAKYKAMYPFLKEVDSLALSNVQLDLKSSFSQFFKDGKAFGQTSNPRKRAGNLILRIASTMGQPRLSRLSIEVFGFQNLGL